MTEGTFNRAKALRERIEYLDSLIDLFVSFVGPDVMGRNKAIASILIEKVTEDRIRDKLIHWEPLEEDIASKFVKILKEERTKAELEFNSL